MAAIRNRFDVAWPLPADPDAGARLLERFAERGRAEARLAREPGAAALLRCLGGNSGYLADLAVRESAALRAVAADGPDVVVAAALARIDATPVTMPTAEVAARLRAGKRLVALVAAVADVGGLWALEPVVAALSDLADAALRLSVGHLLRKAHDAGELVLPRPDHPEEGSGFVVLGMGKLGARELNYSSDVDLVLLHNPEQGVIHGDSAASFFTRLSRGLVALMEARDADGYVFRTDLRLRPDPAATPPCVAMPAAIAYYESMGQNWERAAMLKARPVAGDMALGAEFIAAIRPFVWRRHLDFAAVADISAMKRRIDAHKGTHLGRGTDPVLRIAGHDVKLGEGGIREIEFVAQTLQLVWGGRDPALRVPRTCDALALLARAGHLPRRAATELANAYHFLRRVEHRLQMVADRQTHTLPDTADGLDRFALFMESPTARGFAATLLRHLARVRTHYQGLFETVPTLDSAPLLDFDSDGAGAKVTTAALAAMGYTDPAAIVETVRAWRAGRLRALRASRARALLDEVLPGLLRALAAQPQPDAALRRFDAFLARQAAGVHLMSLFQHNPALLARIAAVLGAAPSLADHLATTPSALEGLLAPAEPADPARVLRVRLGTAAALEDAIAVIRRTVREEDFRVSVATMEGRLDADAAGSARADVADAALTALLPRVLDDFARRHGRVRGGGLCVVLLGKAGGREMMAGSDLDLMLVYDHPADAAESTGARPMAASQYFIRAVHAYVAALTAPDAEGPMYAIDMRLRPSGNKGPVAVSLAAFERYHAAVSEGGERTGAWTWERMALTRARVIAGPARLRARVASAIRAGIANADPARLRLDAAAMRARLARDLPQSGPWDVKFRRGGQIEVEFVAQTLQLLHAPGHPALLSTTTRVALGRLRDAGRLAPDDAALLIRADHVWRSVQGLLRITSGRNPAATLPEATALTLLRVMADIAPAIDLPALQANFDALSQQVRAAFVRLVGEIDT